MHINKCSVVFSLLKPLPCPTCHPCPSSSSLPRHTGRFRDPKPDPTAPQDPRAFQSSLPLSELYKAAPDHVKSPHTAARRSDLWTLGHSLPVGIIHSFLRPVSRRRRGLATAAAARRSAREKKLAKIERYTRTRKRGKRERGSEGGPPGASKIEGSVRRKLMRLLSFVPFGCRAGPVDDAPPADYHHAAAAAGDAAAAARRRRRRRAAYSSAEGAAAQWRPSLGDICEEYSTDAAKAAAACGPARARKAASWDVARVLPRAHSNEYRHLESASSMPAFAPTAFLF